MPVASDAYLARAGRPARLDELAGHALLSWRRPGWSPMQWPLRAGGAVDIDPMAIADNAELLHIAAEQGRGIFLGPVNPACTRGRRRSYRSSMR